jgi:small conductance mechanosensitive channel
MEYSSGFAPFVGAFLILVIGLVLARVLGNTLRRIFKGMELNNLFQSALKLRFDAEKFFASFITWIAYFIVILLALFQLGISTQTIQIVFFVFIGVVVIIALLASKDLIPNIMSGIYLMKTKKVKKGKTLRIRGIEGKVIDFNLVETKIRTSKTEEIFVPNSLMSKELVRMEGKK